MRFPVTGHGSNATGARNPRISAAPDVSPMIFLGIELRAEEKKLLSEAGRFRVCARRRPEQTIYDGKSRKLANDLDYLREKGLVENPSREPAPRWKAAYHRAGRGLSRSPKRDAAY